MTMACKFYVLALPGNTSGARKLEEVILKEMTTAALVLPPTNAKGIPVSSHAWSVYNHAAEYMRIFDGISTSKSL